MGLSLQRELAGPEKYVNGHTVVRTGQQMRAFRIRKSSLQPTTGPCPRQGETWTLLLCLRATVQQAGGGGTVCDLPPTVSHAHLAPTGLGAPIFSCAAPNHLRACNRRPVSWSSECQPTKPSTRATKPSTRATSPHRLPHLISRLSRV